MSLWKHLKAIRDNPALSNYENTVFQFLSYLTTTSNSKFRIERYSVLDYDMIEDKEIPYVHRWTEIYRKSILARLYLLDEWYRLNPSPTTMLTLTTYQDGPTSVLARGRVVTIGESFEILTNGKARLLNLMKQELPSFPYVMVMEPHKSGYPHIHVLIFAEIPKSLQERLKRLWSAKYCAGSLDHGLDFEARAPENIESVRNYLMKYVAKGFVNTGSKFEILDIPWTPELLVYNALVWKRRYRTFQPSRDLCRVMACPKCENSLILPVSSTLIDENDEQHLIWSKVS